MPAISSRRFCRLAVGAIVVFVSLRICAQEAKKPEPLSIQAFERDCWVIKYSPEGTSIATLSLGADDLKVWDTESGKLTWSKAKSGKSCAEFSPDGKQLAVGGWNNVQILNVASGQRVRGIRPTVVGGVNGAVYSPDGSKLAVVLKENNIVDVFAPDTGEHLITLTVPMEKPAKGTGGISRVSFSPDGSVLVAACGGRGWPDYVGEDSVIAVWDVKTWKLRDSFTASSHNVNGLAISPDGRLIAASCHRAKEVRVWKMPAPAKERPDIEAIAKLAEELDDDAFGIREAAERKLREIGPPAREVLTKSLDGDSAEAAFRARRILKMMKEEDDGLVHVLKGNSDFQCVAFSPDGKWLATGSTSKGDKSCGIWQLSPQPRATYLPDPRGTWSVDFCPDGKKLARGTVDGAVLVHDLDDLIAD